MEFDSIRELIEANKFVAVILLAIALASVLGIGYFVFFSGEKYSDVNINVTSRESPVWKAKVQLIGAGNLPAKMTDRSGNATFEKIPKGKEITIKISATGFKEFSKTIKIENEKEIIKATLEPSDGEKQIVKSLIFVGPDGAKIEGKMLTIELSCSTAIKITNPIKQVSSGKLDVEVPPGCGAMSAKVIGSGFEVKSYNLEESNIIKLAPRIIEEGFLKVSVKDKFGNNVDGAEVFVNDEFGSLVDKKISGFGKAEFSLEPGDYKIVIVPNNKNLSTFSGNAKIISKETTDFEATLEEQKFGSVKLNIVDKRSKAKLQAKANIELPDSSKYSIEGKGEIEIQITRQGKTKIVVSSNGYLPSGIIEVDSSNIQKSVIDVELLPCTPNTCNSLDVKIIDEENKPVGNAKVIIIEPDTNFALNEYQPKTTNNNGIAKFTGIKNGKYRVIAQKYPANGLSEAFEINEGATKEIILQLKIGYGTIEIETLDEDGKAVPFANAEIFDYEKRIGKIVLDSSGKGSAKIRAGEKVSVVVTAEGYAEYHSTSSIILPEKAAKIMAKLEKESISGNIKISLVEISSDGKKAEVLEPGKSYEAKFLLVIPKDFEYEQAGAFINVGNENNVEKDTMYIYEVDAPKATYLMGSTYNPPRNLEEDLSNLTNGNAKWVQIAWEKSNNAGKIINFGVKFKLKNFANAQSKLFFNYRAFAVKSNGEIYRDPQDSELGFAENSATKKWLYAKTYVYNSSTDCGEFFCFNEKVLDLKEELYLEKPYSLRNFGEYEIEFSILNNKEATYDNAKLIISNSNQENIKILDYSIFSADSEKFGSNRETFKIEGIILGKLNKNKSITGRLKIKPVNLSESGLSIIIHSEKNIVFEKKIDFKIVASNDMNIAIVPEIIPAFTEFELKVEAKEYKEEDYFGVDGANVRVELVHPDRKKTTIIGTTDLEGKALIKIPALEPNTRFKVVVEKPGYSGKSYQLKVTKEILKFSPEKLNYNLNISSKREEKKSVSIANLTPLELELSKAGFYGKFLGLLDEQKMTNYASMNSGIKVGFNESKEMNFIAAISEDGKYIKEKKNISGRLYLEFTDKNKNTWPFEIPFSTAISLAEPPANQNCIEVSIKEWKDATISGVAKTEFYIKNNCIDKKNKPIDLKNLKAKVDWKSNKFGFVEVQAIDSITGQIGKDILADGIFSTLFERVPGGREYIAEIIFTPKGNSLGKKAEFSITIDASQFTDYGEESVGSSNQIKVEIDTLNLRDCIKFTPQAETPLVIPENSNEAGITIDSSACGNMEIDFWMCKDDAGCSGGSEGGILVEPEKFTLKPVNSSKTVRVSRQEIPGIYGVKVFIKTKNTNYRELLTFDVIAKPTMNDAFELNKYSFTLIGNGSKDSTELTNKFLSENITVDASICDWGDATEKGWWDWTGAGVGAIYGALMGIRPALMASNAAAKGVASGIGQSMDATKSAQQASVAADNLSNNNIDAVCSKIDSALSSTQSAYGPCSITPANANITSAIASVQSAKTACENAKNIMSKIIENDSKLQDVAMNGGQFINGRFTQLDASELLAQKEYLNSEVLAYIQQASVYLNAGATSLGSAATIAISMCQADPEVCQCKAAIAEAVSLVGESSSSLQSFVANQFGESVAKTGVLKLSFASTNAIVQSANNSLGNVVASATAKSFFTPTNIMAMYSLGGFFIGGIYGKIFGNDPCTQRHTSSLPDYVINLVSDAGPIVSDNKDLVAYYNMDSAKIIGQYNKQKVGLVFINNGVANQKPSYATFTFNATKHLHALPTKIERGNSNFGPFKVPDREKVNVESKIHLKFKTMEEEETIPQLSFDTLSCENGVKFGRTGKASLPKVRFDWSFTNIDKDTCLEQNPNGIYCDATQFSIMISKRLKALKDFFNQNQNLKCPANPLNKEFETLARDLNVDRNSQTENCYLENWTGFIEGEPAIKHLIEANENAISWTQEIPNKESFMNTIHFNAMLIRDSFSEDFINDFAEHYSNGRFFDTAEWFYKEATSPDGKPYGIANIFINHNISFRNRFFDSHELPSPGIYDVLINISGIDKSFRFFNADGSPNVKIEIEFYLLHEPRPNSAFYYLPLDGLVGLENDSFNRQGYGVSFFNEEGQILFDNSSQPMKTYNDNGSNANSIAATKLEKSFYKLNSSPSTRGNLFILEKISPSEANLVFSPSKATPVMIKVSANSISEEPLSVFYTVANNEVPVDVGETLTFWNGVGACLDFSGTLITESFDSRSDRAATTKDPLNDWESAYGVDFGPIVYKGDSYIRTIFFTNPLEIYSLKLEHPKGKAILMTPEEISEKARLSGITGVKYNDPSGGSTGAITTVLDVFKLVESGNACISDSGRKAEIFWNPKTVYDSKGAKLNISEVSNSLKAGETCIGLG